VNLDKGFHREFGVICYDLHMDDTRRRILLEIIGERRHSDTERNAR